MEVEIRWKGTYVVSKITYHLNMKQECERVFRTFNLDQVTIRENKNMVELHIS